MAKKASVKKDGQLPDPFKMLQKIDKNVEILVLLFCKSFDIQSYRSLLFCEKNCRKL
jgi:hypothetical protein